MFTLFCAMLVYHGTPIWRLHTGLCKFVQNISTNILSLGERTDLKLGEVSSLSICYNVTISWLYPLNGFRIMFSIAWQCKPRIVFTNFQPKKFYILFKILASDFKFWQILASIFLQKIKRVWKIAVSCSNE